MPRNQHVYATSRDVSVSIGWQCALTGRPVGTRRRDYRNAVVTLDL